MGKMDELILVVERSRLFSGEQLSFQGTIVSQGANASMGAVILRNLYGFYEVMRRGDAEEDPNYKQPIPYAIIRRGNEFFLYERLVGGGEARLHNKLSLGVGGHMNDLDEVEKSLIENIGFTTLLSDNLERELNEELSFSKNESDYEVFGLINDDSDDVGMVHFGILITVDIDEDTEVEVNEPEQLSGRWVTMEYLLKPEVYERLESWSKLAVEALEGDQA